MNINELNKIIEIVEINDLPIETKGKAVRTKPDSFKNIYANIKKINQQVAMQNQPVSVSRTSIDRIEEKCNITFYNTKANNTVNIKVEEPSKIIALSGKMFDNLKSKNTDIKREIQLKILPPKEMEISAIEITNNNSDFEQEKKPFPQIEENEEQIKSPSGNIPVEDEKKDYDLTNPVDVSNKYKLASQKYMDIRKQQKEVEIEITAKTNEKNFTKHEGDRLLAESDKCQEKINALKARLEEWETRKNEIIEAAQEKFKQEGLLDDKISKLMEEKSILDFEKPKASEELETAKLDVVRLKEQLTSQQEMINKDLGVLKENFNGMQLVEKSNSNLNFNQEQSGENITYTYPDREHYQRVA